MLSMLVCITEVSLRYSTKYIAHLLMTAHKSFQDDLALMIGDKIFGLGVL